MKIYIEEPYTMSIHTGEKHHILDIIIVSFIKNLSQKTYSLPNLLVKNILLIQCLNLLYSFWSVKRILIFICEQDLYFSYLGHFMFVL